MKYKILLLTLTALFIVGAAAGAVRRQTAMQDNKLLLVRDMLSPEWNAEFINTPIPYFKVWRNDHGPEFIFFTHDLAPEVVGYGGPVKMAIRVTDSGKINDIRILAHSETTAYVGALPEFVKQFLGKSSSNPLTIGQDLDAITRATVSSEAITRTIRKALAEFGQAVLKKGTVSSPSEETVFVPWARILAAAGLFAGAVLSLTLRLKPLRWLTMMAGFLILGIWMRSMLSIVQFLTPEKFFSVGFLNNPDWWITLTLGAGSSLILGRLYCGTMCPFAFVQEALFKVPVKKGPSPGSYGAARIIKYITLMAVLAVSFLTGTTAAGNFEPFVTLFTWKGTHSAWLLLAIVLVLSIHYFRFWCVYLCPVGALTGLASKLSFLQLKRVKPCAACGRCSAVCPTDAIKPAALLSGSENHDIDEAECILCGRCSRACPNQVIRLWSRYAKK